MSKAARLKALARLKQGDRFHLEETGNVYDEVTDEQYQQIVNERKGNNFVEEDGLDLGYADNGEEDDFDEAKAKRKAQKKKQQQLAKLRKSHAKIIQKPKPKPKEKKVNTLNFGKAKMVNPFSSKSSRATTAVDKARADEIMQNALNALDDDDDDSEPEDEAQMIPAPTLAPTLPMIQDEDDAPPPAAEAPPPAKKPGPFGKKPAFGAKPAASTPPSRNTELKEPKAKRIKVFGKKPTPGGPTNGTPSGTTPGGPVLPPTAMQEDDGGANFNPLGMEIDAGDEKEAVVPEEQDGRINIFWFDAHEDAYNKPGTVYLFGKAVKPGTNELQSCCVVVENVFRTNYVLPKEGVEMADVHKEIDELRRRLGVKKLMSGPARMKYSFREGKAVPAEAEYLKICYSYKEPRIPPHLHSGKTYSKIFGTRASAMERFLLERGLVGPCWVSIPVSPNERAVSWAKKEYKCKACHVKTIDLAVHLELPKFKVMSLAMQTVMDKKKRHEIAVVSYVCHNSVNAEGNTENEDKLSCYSLVRKTPKDRAWPFDFEQKLKASKSQRPVKTFGTERELLSFLLSRIKFEDPDIICGHNLYEWVVDLLIHRIKACQVSNWSRIGRLRKNKFPLNKAGKLVKRQLCGRLFCDTFLSAQEFIRETKYSLAHLASTQLAPPPGSKSKAPSVTVFDQLTVGQKWESSKGLLEVIREIENHAWVAMKLMFKLAIIPLSRELTKLCGNLWARSLQGQRAERNEYLLLHEFNKLDYIVPERYTNREKINLGIMEERGSGRRKAAYAGGLVLEPKRGFYDSIILLLDFNSLYPSIIQEYNLCFTTFKHWEVKVEGNDLQLPDVSTTTGILPKVITRLLERRSAVKKLLKSAKDPAKKKSLDIRQKALKLVANSMYGCLGFPSSRFYCKPIAFTITALGRMNLQKVADKAEETIGPNNAPLQVVYGDTDSIMVHTGVKYGTPNAIKQAREVAGRVKKECNKMYKKMYLELDDIFARMLLLRKKKYAALKVEGDKTVQEVKGLDQVRRDWSLVSKDTSKRILSTLLGCDSVETAVQEIHDYLREVRKMIDENKIPLEKFQITKKLTKHSSEYKNQRQPHLQVALRLQRGGKPIQVGQFISYVICTAANDKADLSARAFTQEEVVKSHKDPHQKSLEIDRNWYLENQILPPVQRLCEVISETSLGQLAACLGLDSSKYDRIAGSNGDGLADADSDDEFEAVNLNDFTSRYSSCEPYKITCPLCNVTYNHSGCLRGEGAGMACPSPNCRGLVKKEKRKENIARLGNQIRLAARKYIKRFYDQSYSCTDSMCRFKSKYLPLKGTACPMTGCTGTLVSLYSDKLLHTQLEYHEFLFNMKNTLVDRTKACPTGSERVALEKKLVSAIPPHHHAAMRELSAVATDVLGDSAFNFVNTADLFADIWPADDIAG